MKEEEEDEESDSNIATSIVVVIVVVYHHRRAVDVAMAATAVDEVVLEELRTEIERLSRELDLASTEKIQSAQYGLALLEEKSALQQRCNDFEALYENTKHELEITQEVSTSSGLFTRHARSRGRREREKEKIYSVLATILPRAIKRNTNKECERP